MNESLQSVCAAFIEARDCLKKVFFLEHAMLYPVCANIFVAANKKADPELIKDCKKMVTHSTGIFSSFRGNTIMPLVCTLAADPDPEARWERAQTYYIQLKSQFFASQYLALAATMLAEQADLDVEDLAVRGKSLYKRMRKEHPFLTGQEDSILALLLVQDNKSEDELIADMESCYKLLNQRLPKSDGLQTSSHTLTLIHESPEQKCARMLSLYDTVSARCKRYGKRYELPILAALCFSDQPAETIAADVEQAASYLKQQKGYRSIFGFTRKERLMHAGMLVSTAYSLSGTLNVSGIGTMLAQQATLVIAIVEEIILMSLILSTTASSFSSSHSST